MIGHCCLKPPFYIFVLVEHSLFVCDMANHPQKLTNFVVEYDINGCEHIPTQIVTLMLLCKHFFHCLKTFIHERNPLIDRPFAFS